MFNYVDLNEFGRRSGHSKEKALSQCSRKGSAKRFPIMFQLPIPEETKQEAVLERKE